MKNPSRHLPLAATHVLAAGLGYLLWTQGTGMRDGMRGCEDVAGAAGHAAAARHADRTRADARARWDEEALRRGDELLTRIAGRAPEQTKGVGAAETYFQEHAWISEKADATPPVADPRAELTRLLDALKASGGEPDEMLAVRYLQWLRLDPGGAIAFTVETNGSAPTGALIAAVDEMSFNAFLPYLGKAGDSGQDLQGAILAKAAQTADAEGMAALKAAAGDEWEDLLEPMAERWPPERAEDLFQLAVEEGNIQMLVRFAASGQNRRSGWLVEKLASGALPEEMQRELEQDNMLRWIVTNSTEADLGTRLEVMRRIDKEKSPAELTLGLGVQDVATVLDRGRDWRYAYKNGTATMEEIHASVAAQLPQLAATSPEAIRGQLFRELAEDNGAAALTLLDGLPDQQKWETAITAPRDMFNQVDPQDFYDFLQHIPADPAVTGEKVWDQRLEAWNSKTATSLRMLGENYVEWVENLPPGPDREMAAFAILRSATHDDDHKQWTERVRAQVKDPKLVEKLVEYAPADE